MRRKFAILILLAVAFGLSLTVMAQEGTKPLTTKATPVTIATKSLSLSGEVISVVDSAKTLVMKDKKGETIAFSVDPKAKIEKAGKEIILSKLSVGEKVMVKYKTEANKKIATIIKVIVPPSLGKTKTEKTTTGK